MVEFALVFPVLALVVMGGMQFGLLMNNYSALSEAARAGARQFSISRISNTPYADTLSQVTATAATLTTANISMSLFVNGASCTTDATCKTALTPARGLPMRITLTYPCLAITHIVRLANPCTLTASISERVE